MRCACPRTCAGDQIFLAKFGFDTAGRKGSTNRWAGREAGCGRPGGRGVRWRPRRQGDRLARLGRGSQTSAGLVSIGDRATVERLMAMIADLQTQKVALHPEKKQ